MRILGISFLVTMAIVTVAIGIRLMSLAIRTRGVPEGLIAGALLLMAFVGGPLCGIGRMPGWMGTPLGDKLFAVGIFFVQLAIVLIYAFTWRVFRAESALARVLLAVVAAGAAVEWWGLVDASNAQTAEAIFARARPWGMATVASLGGAFAWTGVESFVYFDKLRRRLRVGIGDPVVADRVRLWAIGGTATTALCIALLGTMAAGLAPLRHPIALIIIGAAAAVVSGCWSRAFLPSPAYLARVRARATTG